MARRMAHGHAHASPRPHRRDALRPDVPRADFQRADPVRTDDPRADVAGIDRRRPDAVRPEVIRPEPLRPDADRAQPVARNVVLQQAATAPLPIARVMFERPGDEAPSRLIGAGAELSGPTEPASWSANEPIQARPGAEPDAVSSPGVGSMGPAHGSSPFGGTSALGTTSAFAAASASSAATADPGARADSAAFVALDEAATLGSVIDETATTDDASSTGEGAIEDRGGVGSEADGSLLPAARQAIAPIADDASGAGAAAPVAGVVLGAAGAAAPAEMPTDDLIGAGAAATSDVDDFSPAGDVSGANLATASDGVQLDRGANSPAASGPLSDLPAVADRPDMPAARAAADGGAPGDGERPAAWHAAAAGRSEARGPRSEAVSPPPPAARPDGPSQPDFSDPGRPGCTTPQLRRFIKSRAYVPMHELRRRFSIDGPEDDVTKVATEAGHVFIGLPEREGRMIGDLLRQGEIGVELSLDPSTPIVIGVYPMRPVIRG